MQADVKNYRHDYGTYSVIERSSLFFSSFHCLILSALKIRLNVRLYLELDSSELEQLMGIQHLNDFLK